MHVAHVIARLNNGGPARVLAALIPALCDLGIRCTVLHGHTAANEQDVGDLLRAAGVELVPVTHLARRIRPAADLIAAAGLLVHLRRLAPDLLHTHTAKAGTLGRVVAAITGRPVLHTFHGHVLHGYFGPLGSALARWQERLCAPLGHLHALTPSQLGELCDRYRIGPARRWRCLPIPVTPVTPLPAPWHAELEPGVPVVGFLGRLTAVKDPHLFLDVLDHLRRRLPVQGLICGDGELLPEVRARIAGEGLPCRCSGFVPAGEALAAMDLLVMTSRNEGLPVTAIEAAGAGVPVVAPPVGGLRDLGRAALLAPRAPTALAAACARLMTDTRLHRRRTAAARALAAELTPARLAPCYAALYRRLAGRQADRRSTGPATGLGLK